jgi:hypothetical protein
MAPPHQPHRLLRACLCVVVVWLPAAAPTLMAHAADQPRHPTLDEYRHFRALAIDLLGRAPRRDELAGFERPGFDLGAWIDKNLAGPGYADRLVRVYMDLLRLEVGPAFTYAPAATTLRRQLITGPTGAGIYVYYRQGQRRRRAATDGEICLSEDDSGLAFPSAGTAVGTPKPVSARALDDNTVLVRPWWLYRDFDDEQQPAQWIPRVRDPDPLFVPIDDLTTDPDGSATVKVRVCKEEAGIAETGTIFVAGREPPTAAPGPGRPAPPAAGKPGIPPALPPGRFRPYPNDDGYAKAHKGEAISCRSSSALTMSVDCGCGLGLRHCLPGDSGGNNPRAFVLPTRTPLGADLPLATGPATVSDWYKFWWAQEAQRFLWHVFADDHDLRELLTARFSWVDGPLAEFYRSGAPASCCDREKAFGMLESAEPLVDPRVLPADLRPSDTRSWKLIPDRGPNAAGLVTMPAFLAKYASRRARAAALYTTFLCKNFVADKEELVPSKEPNLTVRPGCASCHATLEPLSAYFSRIEEGGWTFLPAWRFPVRNLECRKNAAGRLPGQCNFFYDPDFSDGAAGTLRGAYASIEHAAAGAAGAALAISEAPEFAACAVARITSSLLGRPLTSDDDGMVTGLTQVFRDAQLRPRALVRQILQSDAYRQSRREAGP